jgi:energy-coupling factor transporter ATP-binding protein EcfA2
MTLPNLALAIVVGLLLAAITIAVLLRRSVPETFALEFDTAASRAKQGWAAFWSRDPFVAAQRKRQGMAFGTYAVPGGDIVATHIAASDTHQHTLIVGATGSGKSSLLETFARYHLRERQGFTLIDLHGDLFTRVAAWALFEKVPGLVLLDFTKPDLLPGWNPLARMEGVDVGRQVDLLVGVLKRLYAGEEAASWAWGVKVEELMRYGLRACIESRSAMSLADLGSFYLIPRIRRRVLATASPTTQTYFRKRFGAREEMYVSAVLNKLEPFLGSVAVQRFLGQATSTVDLFGAINRGDTILVNLAAGYLGPAAPVMGRLLVNVLRTAALQREALPPEKRMPYALLLDEAHTLADADSGLAEFLVAARKYKVFVTLAAQGLSLFPPSFRPHLLGNTGRQFFFRLPYSEARMLANDIFEPLGTIWREQVLPNKPVEEPLLLPAEEMDYRKRDLANLPVGTCYWLLRDRPYKARAIQVLAPLDLPLSRTELRSAMDTAMRATKTAAQAAEPGLTNAVEAAVEERRRRLPANRLVPSDH